VPEPAPAFVQSPDELLDDDISVALPLRGPCAFPACAFHVARREEEEPSALGREEQRALNRAFKELRLASTRHAPTIHAPPAGLCFFRALADPLISCSIPCSI
jgi:hypothetical protein